MPGDFYSEWLQVPPGERPPDHYTLLGLPLFSDDTASIEQAARKRLARLDRYGIHPDTNKRDACHRLMNEVARARVVLMAPGRKRQYDQELSRSRGVPLPQTADASDSAQEIASVAEGTEAEAEAYLMDLAQAAQRAVATGGRRTRPIPKRSRMPLYVTIVCAAALVCVGAWAWLRTSNRPTKPMLALTTKGAAPAVTAPSLRPEPEIQPQVTPQTPAAPRKVTLFDPGDSPSPEVPKVTNEPPPAPPHPSQAVAPKPSDPLAAVNSSLDRLTDWTVEKGIWSFVEPGKLRGEGTSDIDFDADLPADSTISFRMCVVKGMRPRIHFDGPDIYVGNEGYSKKLTVHGKAQGLSGEPLDYKNGDEIRVKLIFRGADHFEVHLNDHVLAGTCQRHGNIHLRLSGGDWWSKGTTDFWDLQVTRSVTM